MTAHVTVTRVVTSSGVTRGDVRRTSSSVTRRESALTCPGSVMDTATAEKMTGRIGSVYESAEAH